MRKICVVTGTRAEYGLLSHLMRFINEDKELELQIIATNMHLSPEFGLTYKEIEKDGFMINKKVEMLLSADTSSSIVKSVGLGMIGFSDAYQDLKPDLLVVLGDRYEIFGAVASALFFKIPIAHISGGDLTEGAYDDAIRHSISKMSHLHFTTTEEYRRRVIQLGEQPCNVYNAGSIGIDNIKKTKLLSRIDFEESIGFRLGKRNLMVTFHPVTLDKEPSVVQFGNLLEVLDSLRDTHIIFTKPNSDTDGREIIQMIDEYVAGHKDSSTAFISLGYLRYLSALQFMDAVVGNSSSGITEVPSFGIPTVNIGDRQKGRLRAGSVIDCATGKEDIRSALGKAMAEEFREYARIVPNPYEKEETVLSILNVIKNVSLSDLIRKKFYDLPL